VKECTERKLNGRNAFCECVEPMPRHNVLKIVCCQKLEEAHEKLSFPLTYECLWRCNDIGTRFFTRKYESSR